MIPETELVRKAQSGDMSAFTELVQRHDRSVFALAARYVHSAEDAKDIYQEVLIKVFRGLPGFQHRSEFSTWIHRIAVNVCLSHRGRGKHALQVPLDAGTGHDENSHSAVRELHSNDGGPERAAIDADTAEHLRRAIASLPPRQRMVFTLRHYEGQSLKEIAGVLRCSEGAVKRYLFMATRRLRDQLHNLL